MAVDVYVGVAANLSCTISATLPVQALWWVPTLATPLSDSTEDYIVTTEQLNETVDGVVVTMTHVQIAVVTQEMIGLFTCAVNNEARSG